MTRDSVAELFESITKDRALGRQVAESLPYTRVLLCGLREDDTGEVSWSNCKAIEVTTLIIQATRTLFAHLGHDGVNTHWRAIVEEITKERDRILQEAAEDRFGTKEKKDVKSQ